MKIILGLSIIFYYAQLSNAAHFHSRNHIKRSLSARSGSSAESGRSLNLVPRTDHRRTASSWFASWHSTDFPLSAIPWDKYDLMVYAFASTTADSTVGLEQSDQILLRDFVSQAKNHNVCPVIGLGGWSGSIFFSSSVGTSESRTTFAQAIMDVVKEYDLCGVEFDWEYPTTTGIGCNKASPNDSANFLTFLQLLRSIAGKDLVISAAVSLKPFLDSTGKPMTDVSGFAAVLDYLEIMDYDVNGPWSPMVGANAPLKDSCAPPEMQAGSVISAFEAWTQAGFQPCQIIVGVAGYGHSFHVRREDAYNKTTHEIQPYVAFDKSQQPAGDKWDSTADGVDVCGNANTVGGIFNFWGLIEKGFLDETGNPAKGIDYTFDHCSKTPFIYDSTSEIMVSYDDVHSMRMKANLIRRAGCKGFSMWHAGSDYHDILLDTLDKYIGGHGHDDNLVCPT